jgi:rhodanese-related sulfurtransferase
MNDFAEFAQHNWLLFLALFAILGMLVGSEILRRVRGISTLNAAEALRLINDQDAWVVDIRDGGEFKQGHVPQAIVYCRNGATSQSACALLKKNGIAKAYSLNGGLAAWADAHLPVSRKKS